MGRKKERGTLIVLSGPSGVGKSTVIAELLSERKDIYFPYLLPHGSPVWARRTASTIILSRGMNLSG